MRLAEASLHTCSPSKALPRYVFGIPPLDKALGGGLTWGCVHEFYSAELEDAPAVAGFAAGLALQRIAGGTIMWLRARRALPQAGILQANGWAELGGAPGNALVSVISDTVMLLRAAVDALRCPALKAVILEGWGPMPELDLTASRRLALTAGKSGVPLFLLRCDASPVSSAAQTRWQLATAPSRALFGNAPGRPTFDITLLRQRSGPSGLSWRLEWDRDRRQFREAPLSGAVVSFPVDRPAADHAHETLWQPGRYAA